MSDDRFSFGDRVIHPAKPEWGVGTVTAAANASESGKPCQRLTVRFERAGLKTISTAFAPLRPAEEADAAPAQQNTTDSSDQPAGWLNELEGARNIEERMAALPESTRDPFRTIQERLQLTYDLYRFNRSGGSLLDWASIQTGLADPLTRFNRHELELFYDRYATARDQHVVALLRELKRADANALDAAIRAAPSTARNAIRRFNANR